MTATPVKYVLDELGSVVSSQPADAPLKRVDRDNAAVYDGTGAFDLSGSIRDRKSDLQQANVVGASYADRGDEYIGTAPNLDLEEVVGVRIEGLHSSEYGNINPEGTDGVVFAGTDNALVQQILDALYSGLRFPDADRTPVEFTDLAIVNHAPQANLWADYYRYDFDVAFSGYETL